MKTASARVVGMVGRDHPGTSAKAADAVSKRKLTIRQQVERFFLERPFGATDSALWEHFRFDPKTGAERPESSYRKRRTELAEENILIAHGDEAKNHNGQDAKVWRHRAHCLYPPPIRPREVRPSRFDALNQEIARLVAEIDTARNKERDAVVAYLRGDDFFGAGDGLVDAAASRIERGDHRK
jgi:hypothetical protein